MEARIEDRPGILSSHVEIEISSAAQRDTVLGWLLGEFAPTALARTGVKSARFSADPDEADIIELKLEIEGRTLGDASRMTNDVLRDIGSFVRARSKTVTFEETSRTLTRA